MESSTTDESISSAMALFNGHTMEAISHFSSHEKWCPLLASSWNKSYDHVLSLRSDEDNNLVIDSSTQNLLNSLSITSHMDRKNKYKENLCSSPKKTFTETQSVLSKFSNKKIKNDSPSLKRWRRVISQIYQLQSYNPWPDFNEKMKPEKARRYRFSALQKRWIEDDVYIKMEPFAFDHGAMRECYRMKKLSYPNASNKHRVHTTNYVAKRYIDENTDRQVYFEDARLQMEAKLWAEEFNRHDPPKKIDVFQLSILEFVDRPNAPLYHIERFMEGEYRKYNSNSGFVDDLCRNTPQAFSHFTFEHSGHRLLIIDIQGVGDLYTDPQIHTWDAQGYGDGNLGVRGMALFFHSHRCNSICQYLGLDQFELASNEIDHPTEMIDFPSSACKMDFNKKQSERFRIRSISMGESGTQARKPRCTSLSGDSTLSLSNTNYGGDSVISVLPMSSSSRRHCRSRTQSVAVTEDGAESGFFGEEDSQDIDETPWSDYKAPITSLRKRGISECSEVDVIAEEDMHQFHLLIHENHRKSTSVNSPCNLDQEDGQSILAKIHYETAVLHIDGRFLTPAEKKITHHEIDWDSIIHHLRLAAQLGCPESMWELVCFTCTNTQFPSSKPSLLHSCPLKPSQIDCDNCMEYLWRAANVSHLQSMYLYAKLCEKGGAFDELASPNTSEALRWYDKVLQELLLLEDGHSLLDIIGCTTYELCAHMASLCTEEDAQRAGDLYSQAAELATTAMKGRLANKYFELAEEQYSQC